VVHSVDDLTATIEGYLRAHNTAPVRFVWTATAEDILAKVAGREPTSTHCLLIRGTDTRFGLFTRSVRFR
jgi:hypothetical protein